uniref:CUB domain-containing protein n=1 Tax=Panagrolaimus sp. PS1159 TaxID=55785 RepID=A0AC35F4B6_9BILA
MICPNSTDNKGITYWSNKTPHSTGYPNNAECWFNFSVPSKNQIKVTFLEYDLEENCDFLSHSDDNGEHFYSNEQSITLQAQPNGYNNFSSFHFISDGSVQKLGFKISIETQG